MLKPFIDKTDDAAFFETNRRVFGTNYGASFIPNELLSHLSCMTNYT